MFGCKCLYWNKQGITAPNQQDTFCLPCPLPDWPPGRGFASRRINLGELEVCKISKFEFVWGFNLSHYGKKGVSFYKPEGVPDGFHCLGHYCQLNNKPLRGFVLVAREVSSTETKTDDASRHINPPALQRPLDYTLVWSSDDGSGDYYNGCGFFWLPQPPEGYKPLGYLVTNNPKKPELDEVRCVRADLTDPCQVYRPILNVYSKLQNSPFQVWTTRPSNRGMYGKGVSVGTFFCADYCRPGEQLDVALRNLDPGLHAMPNLDQIHALINHYGPTVFFHPDEVYLPSSVSWFFENGALLFKANDLIGEPIDANGSCLPGDGTNDRAFWIDLPGGNQRDIIKRGNLESAKLYVHVKPAFGGTFTDIAMWVFCPFNGPGTLKIGVLSFPVGKIGQHVGDWEHFTLRISNFTGELWSMYFSQHSRGEWVEPYNLEFIEGNKPVVYSSKSGHASYPHPGTYIQGSEKIGVGIRNDAAHSNLYIDSGTRYELIAAEYLGDGTVIEPTWLQYMREWGPKLVYNSRTEIDKIVNCLPLMLRFSAENLLVKLPVELYGEEGPTGPKQKNNWVGDERG